jgi:hypothetical protein
MKSPNTLRRFLLPAANWLLFISASTAVIWQLLPLAVWWLKIGPDLEGEPNAARLEVPVIREFPAPPSSWTRLEVGNIAFVAPLLERSTRPCQSGTALCFLQLEEGTLSIFPSNYLESYQQLVNLRAPDRRDLSIFRSARENWRTIEALRIRVLSSRASLDSFRFSSPGVKGVVARTERDGRQRFVVAAYDHEERSSRGLGVAAVSEPVFVQILGSLEFLD